MDFNLQSEQVNELFDALSKAQGQFTSALKNKTNFFKTSYADLASVIEACKLPLTENGLCYIQSPVHKDGMTFLVTTLAHKSGQWIRSFMPLVSKNGDPQAIGSSMTYFRRYCLAAILGIAQDDDDANEASKPSKSSHPEKSDSSSIVKLTQLLDQDEDLKKRVTNYFTQQGYADYSQAPSNMIIQTIKTCEKALSKQQAVAV